MAKEGGIFRTASGTLSWVRYIFLTNTRDERTEDGIRQTHLRYHSPFLKELFCLRETDANRRERRGWVRWTRVFF